MKNIGLNGRVAVATGASRGIGRAIAIELAGAGAKLALASRDEAYLCDVRDEVQVGQLAEKVKARFGAAHILVNNAGTAIRKNIIDFSFEEWRTCRAPGAVFTQPPSMRCWALPGRWR